jgi:hypothetical protein
VLTSTRVGYLISIRSLIGGGLTRKLGHVRKNSVVGEKRRREVRYSESAVRYLYLEEMIREKRSVYYPGLY